MPNGHVEDHAGPFARDHSGHEVLQPLDDVHVAVDDPDRVTTRLQRAGYALDSARVVALPVLGSEDVDYSARIAVMHDSDAHRSDFQWDR